MRRIRFPLGALAILLFVSGLWGCGFSPGNTPQAMGTAGSTGSGTGGGTEGSARSGVGGNLGTGGLGTSDGSGGDVGITGAAGMSCGQTNVAIQPEPPDILIVQDKSLSMTSIVLTGTACSSLQSGAYSNLQFIYACAGTKICLDHLANGMCAD